MYTIISRVDAGRPVKILPGETVEEQTLDGAVVKVRREMTEQEVIAEVAKMRAAGYPDAFHILETGANGRECWRRPKWWTVTGQAVSFDQAAFRADMEAQVARRFDKVAKFRIRQRVDASEQAEAALLATKLAGRPPASWTAGENAAHQRLSAKQDTVAATRDKAEAFKARLAALNDDALMTVSAHRDDPFGDGDLWP